MDGPGDDDFAFTDAELEQLARAEHERWMRDRIEHGWTPGPRNQRRTHDALPGGLFASSTDDVRELDRAAVRAIPTVLRDAGLGVRAA